MADDIQGQIERLRADIREKETVLADLEAEVLDLRRELEGFQARYDRVVEPVATRLAAARAAIADLEAERDARWLAQYAPDVPPLESSWEPPPDYVPVEEQFRRTWRVPAEEAPPDSPDAPTSAPPKPRSDAEDSREGQIKRLYRKLARRHHPDLATDPDDRARRNELMARINEAYAKRDLATLHALANRPGDVGADDPLATLQLRELRQIDWQLSRRIDALRAERDELLHGEEMQLKLEEKLARVRGRDLLAEMAARLEREYQDALRRLDRLRRL